MTERPRALAAAPEFLSLDKYVELRESLEASIRSLRSQMAAAMKHGRPQRREHLSDLLKVEVETLRALEECEV